MAEMSWKDLGLAVDSGELFIERGVAQNCARHCTDLLVKLVDIKQRASALGDLKGFGTFPSGIALAKKFSLKAVGGDYSMVQALTDHIAEIEGMRDVFLRIEAQYVASDERGAQALAAIDPEVGG